jgi:hypothetical protein
MEYFRLGINISKEKKVFRKKTGFFIRKFGKIEFHLKFPEKMFFLGQKWIFRKN